jgi:small subunit ribosomal protein MRP21
MEYAQYHRKERIESVQYFPVACCERRQKAHEESCEKCQARVRALRILGLAEGTTSSPNFTLVAIATLVSTQHQLTHLIMSSRSLGELLLRPTSIARTPLCQIRRTPASWTSRSISNTPSQPAAQPQRKDDDELPQQAQEPQQPSGPLRIRRTAGPAGQREASQAIDSLFGNMPNRSRPATYAPRGQSTSSEEVRAARNTHVFGAAFSDPSKSNRPAGRGPPKLNFDDMSLPTDMLDPNLSNKPSESANLATQQKEMFANYPRLNPTYGRMVELDASRGRDLVRGIGMLGSLMARNRIKHEQAKQRFHERGGLKRKRLASERWRARFKTGFRDVTRRVSELTSKGW